MKKSYFLLVIFFIFFTTYTPKFETSTDSKLNIKFIEVQNNKIIDTKNIIKRVSFLYEENLFFLKPKNIEEKLIKENFIESFTVKKIFPNTIRLIIFEKKPIAILQIKKKKFYISDKGDVIDFIDLEKYSNLPLVFGGGEKFLDLYIKLLDIKFPLNNIKSFYFFKVGRWDLILKDGKTIKLPVKDYLYSLKSFMHSVSNSSFDNYKIFDYRIKDQLILN